MKNPYLNYYLSQSGGQIQGFQGSVFQQHGRGISSIFRSLMRFITPIWKPVRNEGIKLLGQSFADIQAGKDAKQTIIKNSKTAAANLLNKGVDHVLRDHSGSGFRRKRASKKPGKKRSTKRKKQDFLD